MLEYLTTMLRDYSGPSTQVLVEDDCERIFGLVALEFDDENRTFIIHVTELTEDPRKSEID